MSECKTPIVIGDCHQIVKQISIITLWILFRQYIWRDVKVGLWILNLILQLILEVYVVWLESLEAQNKNCGSLIYFNSFGSLHMILAHVAIPGVLLVKLFRLTEILQTIVESGISTAARRSLGVLRSLFISWVAVERQKFGEDWLAALIEDSIDEDKLKHEGLVPTLVRRHLLLLVVAIVNQVGVGVYIIFIWWILQPSLKLLLSSPLDRLHLDIPTVFGLFLERLSLVSLLMQHLDLFGLLEQVSVLVELLRVHHLLQVLPERLVVAHGDRTVLAVLLTAVNALHWVVAVFVRVVEGVLQVHN